MAKLKPLRELVKEAEGNDVVQFFSTNNKRDKKLKKPEESYVGYYLGYDRDLKHVNFSINPSGNTAFCVALDRGVYGRVYERHGCDSGVNVSHYIILNGAKI